MHLGDKRNHIKNLVIGMKATGKDKEEIELKAFQLNEFPGFGLPDSEVEAIIKKVLGDG